MTDARAGAASRATRFPEATPEDTDAIAALHAASWSRSYRGAFSDAYLDGPVVEDRRAIWQVRYAQAATQPSGSGGPAPEMYTLLALDQGGSLVGFACSFGAEDATWGTLLDNLHVAEGAEGQGLGRALLAASALWAERAYPDGGFYLWVLDGNSRARRFYEHLGATNEGPAEIETPDGGAVTQLRYVWPSIEPLRPHAPAL